MDSVLWGRSVHLLPWGKTSSEDVHRPLSLDHRDGSDFSLVLNVSVELSNERALTLRHAAAVVPVQSISWSAETHMRAVWKLPAEMFAPAVPEAATIGGGTCCIETKTDTVTWISEERQRLRRNVPAADMPLSQLCPWKPGEHLQA